MKELDRKFYEKTLRIDRQHSYRIIAYYILKNIKSDLNSVVDYGCGAGWFLYYFKKYGISDVVGVEPNKNMFEVLDQSIKDNIRFLDLTEKINLNRDFDLAMSIEVAEHIDEEYADLIVENITRHTNLLVFSAAIPGQGGYGHINEQPFEYWVEKFNKINFNCDSKSTKKFRQYLKENKAKSWYVNNISVFERGK